MHVTSMSAESIKTAQRHIFSTVELTRALSEGHEAGPLPQLLTIPQWNRCFLPRTQVDVLKVTTY